MRKLILFITALLSLGSCANRQSVFTIGRQVVSSAPKEERVLRPISSYEGSALFAAVNVEYATDSVLLISTMGTEAGFRVVGLADYHTVDLLPVGRGPAETVEGVFSAVRVDAGKTLLDVVALNEGYIMSIDLYASVREGKTVVVDREDLIPGMSLASFFVKEGILTQILYDADNYSFKLFRRGDHTVLRTDQVFGDEPYLTMFQPQFESVRELKPDQSKLCLMMGMFDEINILDVEGSDHLSISPPKKKKEDAAIIKELLTTRNLTSGVYYLGGCVTDDAIYGLYYGCDEQEEAEGFLPSIRVFSWDGEFKAVYHLSEPLISIVLAEDGHTLYGLTAEEVLYRYDLSQ